LVVGVIVAGGSDDYRTFAFGVSHRVAQDGGVTIGPQADVDDLCTGVHGLYNAFGEFEAAAFAQAVRDAHVEDMAGRRNSRGLFVPPADKAGHRGAVAGEWLAVIHQIQMRELALTEGRMVFYARVENSHGDFRPPCRAVAVSADGLQKSISAEWGGAANAGP